MKSLNMTQIASIVATSLLVTTVGVAASLQANPAPQELDFPAILTADDVYIINELLCNLLTRKGVKFIREKYDKKLPRLGWI